jgi:hypothetical protein
MREKILHLFKVFQVLILISTFSLMFIVQVNAQNDINSYLIKRLEKGGEDSDDLWEYGFNVAMSLSKVPESNLVIRLCSDANLPVAISSAAVDPLLLSEFLGSQNPQKPSISFDRIFIDRSANCSGRYATTTAVELWQTFGKGVPDSKEMISACKIRTTEFKSTVDTKKTYIHGVSKYKTAIKRLISVLKGNKNTFGSITGHYISEPKSEVRNKLRIATSLLKKSGLAENRYDIRLMPWRGSPDAIEPRNLYIRTIEIENNCLNLEKARQVMLID